MDEEQEKETKEQEQEKVFTPEEIKTGKILSAAGCVIGAVSIFLNTVLGHFGAVPVIGGFVLAIIGCALAVFAEQKGYVGPFSAFSLLLCILGILMTDFTNIAPVGKEVTIAILHMR